MIDFQYAWVLGAAVFIPAIVFFYFFYQKNRKGSIKYSNIKQLKRIKSSSWKFKFRHSVIWIRSIVLLLMIIALARPRSGYEMTKINTEGIDIVLTMDLSTSMKAVDFKPNRLEAAKRVAEEFVKGRTNDRIGLIVFASESFTQCPLTLDYGVLTSFLERLDFGYIEDGTAIGMGLATGVNRLKNSKAKSKVMILLTDGKNNSGVIDPLTAADLAKTYNIKVYTIGVGTRGKAMYPVDDPVFGKRFVPMEVDIDENLLTRIADVTGGKYFRATDEGKLKSIYEEISEMEKTKVEVENYMKYKEMAWMFILAGLFLLSFEMIINNTLFRKLP